MKSDDLVSQDVVAGRDRLGDRCRPRVVVRDQLRARPLLRGRVDAASLDLDPLELRLVCLAAIAVAGSDVIDDGAVWVRPRSSCRGAPLEYDGAAGFYRRCQRARGGVLVAVDVGGLVSVGGDETAVEVFGVPSG